MSRTDACSSAFRERLNFWFLLPVVAALYTSMWRALLPGIFVDGAPWSEVGELFVPVAYGIPALSAIGKLDSGYVALLPHIVARLVALIGTPMAMAPLVIQYFSIGIQVFCFFLFAHPTFRPVVRKDGLRWLICGGLSMHPDADLRTIINAAYLLWIPLIALIWRDLLSEKRVTFSRSFPAACLATLLVLSKGQMIALEGYFGWVLLQYARLGGKRLAILWLIPSVSCGIQAWTMFRSLASVPSFLWQPTDPSTQWFRVPQTVLLMVARMIQGLLGGCFYGSGEVRAYGVACTLTALALVVVIVYRLCFHYKDPFFLQALMTFVLVVPPTTVLMAKGPSMVAMYRENYWYAIASRNSVVGTATLALILAVCWERALQAATGLVEKSCLVGLGAWVSLVSVPFLGWGWLLPVESQFLPARSRLHEYLLDKHNRADLPLNGFSRWQMLLLPTARQSKENQYAVYLKSCFLLEPYQAQSPRGCVFLDQNLPLFSNENVQEISRPRRWALPPSAAAARNFAVLVEGGHPEFLVAEFFRADGTPVARLHPLPPSSHREQRITYFVPMTSLEEATSVEFSALAGKTVSLRMTNDCSCPLWWWLGHQ